MPRHKHGYYPPTTYPDPTPSGSSSDTGDVALTVFVFRPGGVTAGNVFATQPPLDAAIAATQGPVTVEVDDSIVSPAVLTTPTVPWRPVGVENVSLVGAPSQTGAGLPQLTTTGGLPAVGVYENLVIAYTVPILTVPAGLTAFVTFTDTTTVGPPGVPLIDSTAAGSSVVVEVNGFSNLSGPENVAWSAATAFVSFVILSAGIVGDNTLVGPIAKLDPIIIEGGSFDPWRQTGITGGIIATQAIASAAQLITNRSQQAAVARAGVASPAGQIAGGAVSTNAPFAGITRAAAANTPPRWRVKVNLEVTTSVAATVTLAITARATGGANYATQYAVSEANAAAGPLTMSYEIDFDNGAFPTVPFRATDGSTDFGIQVTASAGTITTVLNHGAFSVEEIQ